MSKSMELMQGFTTGYVNSPYSAAGAAMRGAFDDGSAGPDPDSSRRSTSTATSRRKRVEGDSSSAYVAVSTSLDEGRLVDDYDWSVYHGSKKRYSGELSAMPSDQIGWAVPWLVFRDEVGKLYMRADYELSKEEGVTAQMDVVKLGDSFFLDDRDVAEYRERFTAISTEELNSGKYIRVFSSDDSRVIEHFKTLKESLGETGKQILEKILSIFTGESDS